MISSLISTVIHICSYLKPNVICYFHCPRIRLNYNFMDFKSNCYPIAFQQFINCTFNLNRLEGDAQVRTIIHMGQHISDLRYPAPGNEDAPLYVLEYNAWSLTAADAVSVGQSFMTMPGGYMLWNATWPVEDRNNIMDEALKGYLTNYAVLSR